jgi:hypothetical protein
MGHGIASAEVGFPRKERVKDFTAGAILYGPDHTLEHYPALQVFPPTHVLQLVGAPVGRTQHTH